MEVDPPPPPGNFPAGGTFRKPKSLMRTHPEPGSTVPDPLPHFDIQGDNINQDLQDDGEPEPDMMMHRVEPRPTELPYVQLSRGDTEETPLLAAGHLSQPGTSGASRPPTHSYGLRDLPHRTVQTPAEPSLAASGIVSTQSSPHVPSPPAVQRAFPPLGIRPGIFAYDPGAVAWLVLSTNPTQPLRRPINLNIRPASSSESTPSFDLPLCPLASPEDTSGILELRTGSRGAMYMTLTCEQFIALAVCGIILSIVLAILAVYFGYLGFAGNVPGRII